jgi:DNA (cytosine-5)-methyltransferase 1
MSDRGQMVIEPKIICEERTDEGLRFFKDNCCGSLRTKDACGDKRVIEEDVHQPTYKIRKLTPKECLRLMSFDDEDYEKIKAIGISNSQMYKMAGNSICVCVLEEIFKKLFNN